MELLAQTNRHSSRTAVVEDDGLTVYLYLYTGPPEERHRLSLYEWHRLSFRLWVANYAPAPEEHDAYSREMPRGSTRHPTGRPALCPEELELVWLDGGHGVALLERGEPLAVIPGWVNWESEDWGFSGYARDVIGYSSLAWQLDDLTPLVVA